MVVDQVIGALPQARAGRLLARQRSRHLSPRRRLNYDGLSRVLLRHEDL